MRIFRVLFLAAGFMAAAGWLSAQAPDPYKVFNTYRAAAEKGRPYPGAPLKGKVLGLANALSAFPFCTAIENGLKRQFALAGGSVDSGWISMDNQYNPAVALKVADAMIARHPDLFIDYQLDVRVNHVIASHAAEAGIPMLAIDVSIPGAPLAGTNNYAAAVTAGRGTAALIRSKWGGWDAADLVVIMGASVDGEHIMLRTEGVADALAAEFGLDARTDMKIVRGKGGASQPAVAREAMDGVLAAHPDAVRIAIVSFNEPIMAGCLASLQGAGRSPKDRIALTIGADETAQAMIRSGQIDGGVSFFPEHYAELIIPVAAAMLTGNPVPAGIFIKNEIITAANIDTYYPKR
jgi:ribose transport system substrate-binding protein